MMKTTSLLNLLHPSPGGAYIHFDNEHTIEEAYFGFLGADNQHEVTSSTSFHAFSVTKTLTAVAIMRLIEKGSLDLDDDISKYLERYKFSKPVTIKQLLSHMSGIANPIPLKWIHLATEHDAFNFSRFADDTVVGHLKNKQPGQRFSYSNINYLVLGRLLEVMYERPYEEIVRDGILVPIGATETAGFSYPGHGHAIGHHKNSFLQRLLLGFFIDRKKFMYKASREWMAFNPFYINGASFGGLMCTPSALASFCRSLISSSSNLISEHTRSLLFEEMNGPNGKPTGMSCGWFTGNLNGLPYRCHAGGGGGFYSEIRVYPTVQKGSVLMLNSSGMTDKRLLDKIDINYLDA